MHGKKKEIQHPNQLSPPWYGKDKDAASILLVRRSLIIILTSEAKVEIGLSRKSSSCAPLLFPFSCLGCVRVPVCVSPPMCETKVKPKYHSSGMNAVYLVLQDRVSHQSGACQAD